MLEPLLIQILGAGTVTLPFAFKNAGLISGVVLIISAYLITVFSMRCLIRACHRLHPRVYSYRGLAVRAFGNWAGPVIEIVLSVLTLGFMIIYTIIIGDYLALLATEYLPFLPIMHHELMVRFVAFIFVMFPLCCLKSLSLLSFTSSLAVFCVLFTMLFLLCSSVLSIAQGEAAVVTGNIRWWRMDMQSFIAINLFSSAFAAHFTLPTVYQELKKKELTLLSPSETPAPRSRTASVGGGITMASITALGSSMEPELTQRKGDAVDNEDDLEAGTPSPEPPYPALEATEPLGSLSPVRRDSAQVLRRTKEARIVKSGADRDWRRVSISILTGISICLGVYLVVGISGYLQFGEDTLDNILMSFGASNVGRDMSMAAMAFVILFSFPIIHYACRQSVLNGLCTIFLRRDYRFGWVTHLGSAGILCVITLLVATVIPSVSFVFSLLFSLIGTSIYFMLPAIFYLRFRPSFQGKDASRRTYLSELKDKSAWGAVALIIVSPFLGALSLYCTLEPVVKALLGKL